MKEWIKDERPLRAERVFGGSDGLDECLVAQSTAPLPAMSLCPGA